MRSHIWVIALLSAVALTGGKTSSPEEMGNLHRELDMSAFYLPNATASRVVTVATNGVANANLLVQTQRVALKETGPKETVEKFGEVYAFSPNFFCRSQGRSNANPLMESPTGRQPRLHAR